MRTAAFCLLAPDGLGGRAHVDDVALAQLERFGLRARYLPRPRLAVGERQLDADLEAESNDPVDHGLLGAGLGIGEQLKVVRTYEPVAQARDGTDEVHDEVVRRLVVELG